MLAFSNDYYGMIFRATQSVELFCAYSDKGSKWILYPSNEAFNDPIGAIIYKGVK